MAMWKTTPENENIKIEGCWKNKTYKECNELGKDCDLFNSKIGCISLDLHGRFY